MYEPLSLGVLDELAELDRQSRQGPQRREVGVLPGTLRSAPTRRIEARSEEAHELDAVAWQGDFAETHEVQPLVGSKAAASEGGVSEVEAVDVHTGARTL